MKTIEARIGDYGLIRLDVSLSDLQDAEILLRDVNSRLKLRTEGVACIIRALLDGLGLARGGAEITLDYQGVFDLSEGGGRSGGVTYISICMSRPHANDEHAKKFLASQAVRLTDLVSLEVREHLKNSRRRY